MRDFFASSNAHVFFCIFECTRVFFSPWCRLFCHSFLPSPSTALSRLLASRVSPRGIYRSVSSAINHQWRNFSKICAIRIHVCICALCMSASTSMYRSLYIFVSKSLHLYLPRRLQASIYIEMHTYKCIFECTRVHMFRVRLLIFIHTCLLHILLQISTGVKAWLQKKGLWENPNGSARAGKKKKIAFWLYESFMLCDYSLAALVLQSSRALLHEL